MSLLNQVDKQLDLFGWFFGIDDSIGNGDVPVGGDGGEAGMDMFPDSCCD